MRSRTSARSIRRIWYGLAGVPWAWLGSWMMIAQLRPSLLGALIIVTCWTIGSIVVALELLDAR